MRLDEPFYRKELMYSSSDGMFLSIKTVADVNYIE